MIKPIQVNSKIKTHQALKIKNNNNESLQLIILVKDSKKLCPVKLKNIISSKTSFIYYKKKGFQVALWQFKKEELKQLFLKENIRWKLFLNYHFVDIKILNKRSPLKNQ